MEATVAAIEPGRLAGTTAVPPSKSAAHRAVVCAALAAGTSHIGNVEFSQDILATLGAAQQLGAKVERGEHELTITGRGNADGFATITRPVFCNESGSTLRFILPLFSLTAQKVRFTGAGRLMQRPQEIYAQLFERQGLRFEQNEQGITIFGRLCPGTFTLPGNVSSQFISGLLFALPLLSGDSTLHLIPPVESRSYIDMTRSVQAAFGVQSHWLDENTLAIPGGQHYHPCDYTVEGDYSQAAFPAVLGAVCGGVTITGLAPDTLQGDAAILDILRRCGAVFTRKGDSVTFAKAPLHGVDIDLADCPDLGPVLMVLGLLGCDEKQSTALAADQGSDVMQVNWNWLFQYSGKGQSFVNLNDYSDVLDLTQFPSSALDACTVANSLQAVPVAMAGRIYYWNMATFKKAGLDHYPTTEQELLDAAKTFQEKLGDDYYPLAAGPLDRMIMMTFYLESKYGEPWVTDSTLNYTVEQLQEGLEWIQSLEDNHVMPDLKTMNAAGDKTITDGQAWITGKYAGIFTWDSSALSASQNLPDDAEYVVGDEIKWGEAANGGFSKVSMGMAVTQSCEHPVEAAALINFILNEKEGASIMGTQCGMVCSKAGQEYAKEAGAVNELILEANTKVMAFVDQPFDPCYESTSLKDETNGVYGDVFEGFSYDQYDSAEAAQILYDGICEALA